VPRNGGLLACGRIGKGHVILQLSKFGCGLSNSQTESPSFTLDVVECQGMWASGQIGKGHLIL
jgi:hypothetical protein